MKQKGVFFSAAGCFFLSAVSALWITMVSREAAPTLSDVLAVLFWCMAIAGFVLCAILAKKTRPKTKALPRPFYVFQNLPLKITDTLFVLSLILTIVFAASHINIALIWSVLIFSNILSFELHFLFSVKN